MFYGTAARNMALPLRNNVLSTNMEMLSKWNMSASNRHPFPSNIHPIFNESLNYTVIYCTCVSCAKHTYNLCQQKEKMSLQLPVCGHLSSAPLLSFSLRGMFVFIIVYFTFHSFFLCVCFPISCAVVSVICFASAKCHEPNVNKSAPFTCVQGETLRSCGTAPLSLLCHSLSHIHTHTHAHTHTHI